VVTQAATDAEAILASREEPEAFVLVFDRHFAAIHRYLHRRVGKELADDLAAETFAQAFQARHRFDARYEGARPWLYGIASNLLRHHRRDEERQLRAYARTGVDPIETSSPMPAGADSVAPQLAGALAALRGSDREVLLLFAWAELDYREIAEALAIPVGTVRSRLSRARAQVRRLLEPDSPHAANETTPARGPTGSH
jgi:RNA polymerase sigma-70 factor (ECF subfamily)